jgi:hypothetical protein
MGPVYVASARCGLGVFAARRLVASEEILRFRGRLVSAAWMRTCPETAPNLLQIDDELYRDLHRPGRLVNHSCDPNAGIVEDCRLVALRGIAPGEEICYDYSTTMMERLWTMECRCGTRSCRRTITDFDLLPPGVRARYVDLRIVQSFIVRRLYGVTGSSCQAGRHGRGGKGRPDVRIALGLTLL